MKEDNFNIFEFFRIINKEKIIIIFSILLFLIFGFFIKFLNENKFSSKLVVQPLSLINFEEKYTNFYKIDNTSKIENDHISLREISPLTLFYSFLTELKDQKIKNKLSDLKIEWNFLGGQHEIYLIVKNFSSKEELVKELDVILDGANKILLQKLERNLTNHIVLIEELINKADKDIEFLETKKSILINNLNETKGMKLVNYNTKGLIVKKKFINSNKIIILMGLLGLALGIIIALTVTYFNNTKSK